MITFKPIIIQGGKRKDGTWPVKIRVTFKGKSRRLPTTLSCREADVTRSGRIKSATVLERADELIRKMREPLADLSFFTLESWDIDDVVRHIRRSLTGEKFALDFFEYADGFIEGKKPSTKHTYVTALNAFARFLGSRSIDINAITRQMLLNFMDWCGRDKASPKKKTVEGLAPSIYVRKLGTIYNAAKFRYNDEDAGIIVIPRSPFAKLGATVPRSRGQKPLSVEVIQRLIDTVPDSREGVVARATFLLSFGTMGANMADLYKETKAPGEVWTYNRKKTADTRPDGAEVRVRMEKETSPLVGQLCDEQGHPGWWLGRLHEHITTDRCTLSVNRWLHKWATREGIEPFTFYAARHSWATLARRCGAEKATVDEALAHVGDYRMADVYAERNWSLAWEANRKVLDLFRWL